MDTGHPTDHRPFYLLLRQEMRIEGDIVDVFYCTRCLGRVETVATGTPVSAERLAVRGPLQALGTADRR